MRIACLILLCCLAASAADDRPRRDNLQALGFATALYRRDHEGRWPERIGDLFREGYAPSPSLFVLPGKEPPAPGRLDELTDYALASADGQERPALMVWEKQPGADGRSLAFYSDHSFRERASSATAPVQNPPPTAAAQPIPPPQPLPSKEAAAPVDVAAALKQGREFTDAGKVAEALEVYRRAARQAPEDKTLGLFRASLELAAGDLNTALQVSEALLKRHPDDSPVLALRGVVAQYQGDFVTAQKMYARCAQLDPKAAQSHYDYATGFNQKRVFNLALQHYAIAAMMEPQRFYVAHYYMGAIYEAINQPARAATEYDFYLRYDATSQWAGEARQRLQRLRTPPPLPGTENRR